MKECYTSYEATFGPFIGMHPVVSCAIYDEETGRTGRGIAICSVDDEFNFDIAFKVARQKAIRGMKDRGDERINRNEAISILITTNCPWTYSVQFRPALTFQEQQELYGKKSVYTK